MADQPRLFAIIPAAGQARRMGRPKLTLPLGNKTVIRRLLDALQRPVIAQRIVVQRRDDAELFAEIATTTAAVVRAEVDPPDMRASVQLALDFLDANFQPDPKDGWLLVPADHPVLDAGVIDRLIAEWHRSTAEILIPTHNGQRGHPTFFRWRLVRAVYDLPPDRGLNALVAQHADAVTEFAVDDDSILSDLDTPADFERLRKRFETNAG